MAISDRDFYASHGLYFDYKNMLDEYIKGVINQAKIEVLTELQLEIEKKHKEEDFMNDWSSGYNIGLIDTSDLIQQKISELKEDHNNDEKTK